MTTNRAIAPSTGGAVARVAITLKAGTLLRRLQDRHGSLMFHQSGGCCDGSAPMCYPRAEFIVGEEDVLLGLLPDQSLPPAWGGSDAPGGVLDGWAPGQDLTDSGPTTGAQELQIPDELTPVWISGPQYDVWKHTQLLVDVVPGRAGVSLEAPEGVRFLTRGRLFDERERAWLEACPAPRGRNLPHR